MASSNVSPLRQQMWEQGNPAHVPVASPLHPYKPRQPVSGRQVWRLHLSVPTQPGGQPLGHTIGQRTTSTSLQRYSTSLGPPKGLPESGPMPVGPPGHNLGLSEIRRQGHLNSGPRYQRHCGKCLVNRIAI